MDTYSSVVVVTTVGTSAVDVVVAVVVSCVVTVAVVFCGSLVTVVSATVTAVVCAGSSEDMAEQQRGYKEWNGSVDEG